MLLPCFTGSNKIARALNNVHEGGVGGLCVLSNGSFVTGGKDRKIIQWDSQCQKIGSELEVHYNRHFFKPCTRQSFR
jgi:hypothetical protein